MANEDFVVRFGSNAHSFKTQLKKDIEEVNGLVGELRKALAAQVHLDVQVNAARGGNPAGGGRPGGGFNDKAFNESITKMVDGLQHYTESLGTVISGMKTAASVLEAAARATASRTTGANLSEAAKEREANNPLNSNLPNIKKAAEQAIAASLEGGLEDAFDKTSVKDVPRAEIDAAQLARMTKALDITAANTGAQNKKMDHLIGMLNKGITVRVAGGGGGGGGGGRGGGGGGGGGGGTPATPKGSPAIRSSEDDPFGRVSQIRGFIKKRKREEALQAELERLTSGGAAPTGEALGTLLSGSKRFKKLFEETGGEGEKYKSGVQKRIESVRSELADVPKLKTLQSQLKTAIEATGTPDGRLTREQAKERAATKQKDAAGKASTTSAGHRKEETGEDRNTRVQRQIQEATAVVKGYNVVVVALQEAIDDVAAGKKQAPAGVDLQAKLAKAKQDLAEAEAALAKAKRKAEGTRAERKAENREAAKVEREAKGPQVTGREAREKLDFLDIAGSTDALRGQSVKRLRELAATFRAEGYEVKVPRNANKDQLAQILNDVHRQFEAAGRVTNSNLEKRASRYEPTSISPQARQILGDLLGKVGFDDDTRARDAILSEAYQGGYSGQGKRKNRPTASRDVAYSVKGNKEEINETEAQRQARLDKIARAATLQTRKALAADPSYNPYAPGVDEGIKGKGGADARFALAAIRAVVDRLDKLGEAALHAHDTLDKMDKRAGALSAMEAKANQFAGKNNLTAEQSKQYTSLLADIKDLKARVAQDAQNRPAIEAQLASFYKQARQQKITEPGQTIDGKFYPGKRIAGLNMDIGDDFFSRANFGAGYDARKQGRFDQQTRQMQRAEAASDRVGKAMSSSQDITQAVLDTLFGRRNALNSAGQVPAGILRSGQSRTAKRVPQVSTLPDIFNNEFIRTEYPNLKEEDLAAARKATNKYAKEIKKSRQMEQENRLAEQSGTALPNSKEALDKQAARVNSKLEAVFAAVEKVTGVAAAKAKAAEERLSRPEPGEAKNTKTAKVGDSSVLTSQTVNRAEKIIEGGTVTKDMPMVMGKLAKSLGMSYATDIKGQAGYQGIEGLKRLLAEALKGPTGKADSGAAQVKEAVKAAKAGGGMDDDCCTKIVAGLNRIVETLKGGLRVTGLKGGDEETTVTAGKRVAGRRRGGTFSPEEVAASKELIRKERELIDQARAQRISRREERVSTTDTSQTMKEVAAARDLEKTLASLDAKTLAHIEVLKKMKAEGKSTADIYRQMENVYRGAAVALREKNPSEGVGRRTERIGAVLSESVGSKIPTQDVRRLGIDIENELSNSLRQAAQQNTGNAGPLVEALFGGKGFMSRVLNSTGTFLVRNFTAGFVFGITNALQDAAMQAIETESTFVRVSEALNSIGRDPAGLRTGLAGLSQDYGVALKDVYTTAAGLTGVTDSNEELLNLTKVATELQLISGGALNATEAMKALAGITSAYGEVSAEHIGDVATVIQNRLSVNIEETIEGVARLSGQAVELGLSFENAAVYVAAISKFTNQTGAGAGEQFSRILAALQTGRAQSVTTKALGSVGVDVSGAFAARNYQDVLTALLGTYDQLTAAEQDRVAVAIGGQRQAAAVQGLLREGAKINATVTAAVQSQGAAEERATAISAELAAMLVRVRTAFVNFIGVLQRSGAFEFFKVALGAALITLEGINYGLNKFNDLLDTNPVTRFGRTAVGIFAGLAVSIAVVRRGIMAMLGALGAARIAASVVTGGALSGAAAGTLGTAGAAGAASTLAARNAQQQAAGRATLLASLAGIPAFFAGRRARAVNPATYARRDNLGYAAALGYGAMAIPQRRIGIDFDEDGNARPGSTRRGRFFGARSVNADNRAERLRASAARLEESAAERRALSTSRFAGSAAATGAAASRVGAAANAGLGAAMAGLSVASGPVILGLLGVAAGMGFLAWELNNAAKATDEFEKRYEKVFGDQGKKKDDKKVGISDNIFRDAVDENMDKRSSNKDFFSWAANQGLRAFSNGTTPGQILRRFGVKPGQTDDERWGFISDDMTNDLNGANDPALAGIKRAGKDKDKIQAALAEGMAALREEAEKIKNSDMSGEQKDTATAIIQDEMNRLQQSANDASMAANGLNKLNSLTIDQLQNIGTLVSTIVNFSPEMSKAFAPLLQNLIESFGFTEGSDFQKIADSLVNPNIKPRSEVRSAADKLLIPDGIEAPNAPPRGQPGSLEEYFNSLGSSQPEGPDTFRREISLTDAEKARNATPQLTMQSDRRRAGIKILEGALQSATISLENIEDPNSEAAVAARGAAISLAGQLAQAIADDLSQTVADANALAEQERFGGDFEGAAAAAESALAKLRGKREALDPNDVAARATYNNQINQILKQQSQDEIQEQINANNDAARSTRIRAEVLKFQVANARATLNKALEAGSGFSAADVQGFRDNLKNLENQAADLANQEAAAADETALTNIAPGDVKAVALKRVENARKAQTRARIYGLNSVEYQTATQNLTRALRDSALVDDDIVAAQSELSIALAEVAGDRNLAARLAAEQAEANYQKALREAGGNKNAPSVIRADAARVRAGGNERDVALNEQIATIDFQREIGEISSNTAISMLQMLLQQTNLTQEQRRNLRLKIKGLQDDIRSQLTSSGFNIPSEVQLPTAYEVRRSLGLDAYVKEGQKRLDSLGSMQKSLAPQAAATQQAPNPLLGLASQLAQPAAGPSVTNNVEVNNTVSSPAMVEAVARRVVELIGSQTTMGLRANQTSPSLVRY